MFDRDKIRFEIFYDSVTEVVEAGFPSSYYCTTEESGRFLDCDDKVHRVVAESSLYYAKTHPGREGRDRIIPKEGRIDGHPYQIVVRTKFRFDGVDPLHNYDSEFPFYRRVALPKEMWDENSTYDQMLKIVIAIIKNLWKDIKPARKAWLEENKVSR